MTQTRRKRYYTPDEANRTLPLIRSIVREVMETTAGIKDLAHEVAGAEPTPVRRAQIEAEVESRRERLEELQRELAALGIELKDPEKGLVDYWARRGGREVYLCWQFGEESVLHWHDLRSGFGGRKPIATFPAPVPAPKPKPGRDPGT
jgi:hypothetical protein